LETDAETQSKECHREMKAEISDASVSQTVLGTTASNGSWGQHRTAAPAVPRGV
jgi:hypothetical protein